MRFFILTVLLVLLTSCAQAKEPFLDIKEIKTKSGITAWLVEDHSLPILSLSFAFRDAGAINDTPEKQGQTQLLSNMLDEGAGEMDSQTFQKTLTDNSISLSFTSSRDTFGGNLKTLSRNKETAFELLKLSLTSPRFDEEPLGRMKDANLTRIRNALSDPEWKAARLMNDRAYQGHPYALNSGGTLSSLPKITSDDLRRIMQTRFGKENLFVSATGDITAEELDAYLEAIFSHLPEKASLNSIEAATLKNQGSVHIHPQDIPQSIVEIMLPAFGNEDTDYYAMIVMDYIFGGGGFGSYLMDEVREKRGLTYGIYSSLYETRKGDFMNISFSTKNENTSQILAIIKEQMERLKTQPVSPEKLADAKSYLTGSIPLSLTSSDKIAGMMLSLQIDDLPANYLDGYVGKINDVTAEDILRVANRILKPENMMTVIVGSPKDIPDLITMTDLPNVE